jgi:predicted metal-dependent hydrolase
MRKTNWRQLLLPFFKASPKAPSAPVAIEPGQPPSKPVLCAPILDEVSTLEAHRLRISGYLTMHLPDSVRVTFTENRSTMVSFRKHQGCLHVRLHQMFRHADTKLLNHLVGFLGSKRAADSNAIDEFIASHRDEIAAVRKRRVVSLTAEGRCIDLKEVLKRVASKYFGGHVDVHIGWGRAPKRKIRRRRTRTFSRALATYSFDDKTIRVSPVLDAENVPEYVIDWIVYHEVLHHVLPVKKAGDRNLYHSQQFRSLERGFEHFEKAKAWEEKHIEQLLK